MIPVTRLDGSTMIVNDDQIAWIERHPDTVISMMNGEKLLVKETPDVLVERARQFRRSLAAHGALRLAESAWAESAWAESSRAESSRAESSRADASRPDASPSETMRRGL
jgi:flagellar protein FlbD